MWGAELRLEERGALGRSCWRWVGREACRERVPPRGREEEEEEEEGQVIKLVVRVRGQRSISGWSDGGSRRREEHGMVPKQLD